MKIQFVFLALVLSLFFEFTYFFFIQYIQKSRMKKTARIANTFLYEITPRFNEKTSFINYVLIFAIAVTLFPFIYLLVDRVNSYSVSLLVVAVLLTFTLCCIPFIGLEKLREHLFLDVGAIGFLTVVAGLEAFYSLQLYRVTLIKYQLAAGIISLAIFAFMIAMIINPKLFDLKNDMDDEGNPKRKRTIFLALSEWLLYPLFSLTLIPLLLIIAK